MCARYLVVAAPTASAKGRPCGSFRASAALSAARRSTETVFVSRCDYGGHQTLADLSRNESVTFTALGKRDGIQGGQGVVDVLNIQRGARHALCTCMAGRWESTGAHSIVVRT